MAPWLRRLPHYVYFADMIEGKRVLEINCQSGFGAQFLANHGAAHVVGVDASKEAIEYARSHYRLTNLEFRCEDPAAIELEDGSIDCIFVPEGDKLLRREPVLQELRRVLAKSGQLVFAASSADRPSTSGGVSFYEFADHLEPLFAPVRMVAEAPFVATSLVEYGEEDGELDVELDNSLLELDRIADFDVWGYIAICGGYDDLVRGFALVQLPGPAGMEVLSLTSAGQRERLSAKAVESSAAQTVDSEQVAQLRRQLDEAQQEVGQITGSAAVAIEQARRDSEALRKRVLQLEADIARREESEQVEEGQKTAELPRSFSANTSAATAAPSESDTSRDWDESPTGSVQGSQPSSDPALSAEQQAAERDQTVAALVSEALSAHAAEQASLQATLSERQAYVEELRDDLNMALREAAQARSRCEQCKDDLAKSKAELAEWRTKGSIAEGEVLKLSAQLEQQTANVSTQSEGAIRQLQRDLDEAREQVDRVTTNWKQAEAKSDDVWRRVGELQSELEQSREDSVARSAEQRQQSQLELARAREEGSKKLVTAQDKLIRSEREIDELKKLQDAGAERVTNLEHELQTFAQERQELERALEQERMRVCELEEKVSTLTEAATEHEETLQAAQSQLQKAHARAAELERALDLAEKQVSVAGDVGAGGSRVDRAVERLTTLRGQADIMESELASSRHLIRELEEGLAQLKETDDSHAEPAGDSAQARVRQLAIELGLKDAELTLMNLGVSTLQQRLSYVVELVQRTRDTIRGEPEIDVRAMVDQLAHSLSAVVTGNDASAK